MSSAKLRFRDYELDPDEFELCRAGHRLHLERKPMELLILLAEKQGQLVKREEIIEKVWGKDFFFDAENGINNAVRKIRSVLNDDSEQPRFVETSFGKGYRFIAAVERVVEPAGPPVVEPDLMPQGRTAFRWRLVGIPAFAVVAFIAAAFAFDLGGIRKRVFDREGPAIHSIAVLPLENLSGDANQEYFADGMTDALITELAQVSSLRVISRTSALHYKGSHQPLPAVARELNVDAVVEGTVIRSGDRVRITAQLLDARSDRHLWAKAYDRDVHEIMSLQQDVAGNIVQEIQAKLTPEENLRARRKRQVDPEAYDDYLRGSYFWFKFTDEGMKRAAEYFEKSVQKDPSYALGYAWLANAYGQLALFVGPPKDFIPKAKEAAEKAVQLDDSLAEAHASLADKYIYDHDFAGAERELRRALQLSPGNALIHGGYARYLDIMGRFEEASRQHQITRELDPLMLIGFYIRGDHFLFLRQYDQAIAEFRTALDLDPNFFIAHRGLAKAYKSKGMEKESVSEWEQEDMLAGNPKGVKVTKIAYANGGYEGLLKAWLKDVQQRERAEGTYIGYSEDAWMQVQLGNKDLALQALEKAFAEGEDLGLLNVEPEWDPIRSDPRFQDLLRRVGLPVPAAAVTIPH